MGILQNRGFTTVKLQLSQNYVSFLEKTPLEAFLSPRGLSGAGPSHLSVRCNWMWLLFSIPSGLPNRTEITPEGLRGTNKFLEVPPKKDSEAMGCKCSSWRCRLSRFSWWYIFPDPSDRPQTLLFTVFSSILKKINFCNSDLNLDQFLFQSAPQSHPWRAGNLKELILKSKSPVLKPKSPI